MAERFYDAFGSIHGANLGQHVGGVSPLVPMRFEPSSFFAQLYHSL